MKRVYLILTLFVTSFFLLSSNVKADTISVEITEDITNYILSDDFIKLRNKSIEYCNENNKYYVITHNGVIYLSYIFDINSMYVDHYASKLYISPGSPTSYKIQNNEFVRAGYTSDYVISKIPDYNCLGYLDTNIPFLEYKYEDDFTFSYKRNLTQITYGEHFPSIYQIYMDTNSTPEVEENPKLEIVTNFYVLVIDKIKLLTDYIATDYIILSALVIFVFIAVIGLVRRLK